MFTVLYFLCRFIYIGVIIIKYYVIVACLTPTTCKKFFLTIINMKGLSFPSKGLTCKNQK